MLESSRCRSGGTPKIEPEALARSKIVSAARKERGRIADAAGFDSGKLAEKVGLSARYIQKVDAGECFPSLPTLVRLRATLRCDWNELFAGCEKA
jgi:transcriptional regulator with XRE-family HTH domain